MAKIAASLEEGLDADVLRATKLGRAAIERCIDKRQPLVIVSALYGLRRARSWLPRSRS